MVGDDYEKDYLVAKMNGISALLYAPFGENSNDSDESIKKPYRYFDYCRITNRIE